MSIPTIFTERGSEFTASFDWFDVFANAGYKKFYAVGGKTSAANQYFLSQNSDIDGDLFNLYSNDASDIDFDLTFNNPITVAAADCYINYTTVNNTANKTNTLVFTVYHVSVAAVETSLGTVTVTKTSTSNPWYLRGCVKMALTSKAFALGEKLRFNMVTSDDGGTSTHYFDPSSRVAVTESGSGVSINSDLTIEIPFKVQI